MLEENAKLGVILITGSVGDGPRAALKCDVNKEDVREGDKDGNAIETLLMTAQINTDFVNHSVPSTTEPSTSLVRVGTHVWESTINSILRYKDYDSHKNTHKDFQQRFIVINLSVTGVRFVVDYGLEMV
ncbi:uncharacterized protein TNCV_3008541 [Trichonephila clavipes]|nr:uncharacterized protein TNCV_3008541 [Trichonephila clavipes]